MSVPSQDRCDAELSNGKRCQNRAQFWLVGTFQPNAMSVEQWPMAVCELHAKAGRIVRAGPDRRGEYANRHATKATA